MGNNSSYRIDDIRSLNYDLLNRFHPPRALPAVPPPDGHPLPRCGVGDPRATTIKHTIFADVNKPELTRDQILVAMRNGIEDRHLLSTYITHWYTKRKNAIVLATQVPDSLALLISAYELSNPSPLRAIIYRNAFTTASSKMNDTNYWLQWGIVNDDANDTQTCSTQDEDNSGPRFILLDNDQVSWSDIAGSRSSTEMSCSSNRPNEWITRTSLTGYVEGGGCNGGFSCSNRSCDLLPSGGWCLYHIPIAHSWKRSFYRTIHPYKNGIITHWAALLVAMCAIFSQMRIAPERTPTVWLLKPWFPLESVDNLLRLWFCYQDIPAIAILPDALCAVMENLYIDVNSKHSSTASLPSAISPPPSVSPSASSTSSGCGSGDSVLDREVNIEFLNSLSQCCGVLVEITETIVSITPIINGKVDTHNIRHTNRYDTLLLCGAIFDDWFGRNPDYNPQPQPSSFHSLGSRKRHTTTQQ